MTKEVSISFINFFNMVIHLIVFFSFKCLQCVMRYCAVQCILSNKTILLTVDVYLQRKHVCVCVLGDGGGALHFCTFYASKVVVIFRISVVGKHEA